MGQNDILHLSDHEQITHVWCYSLFSVSFEKKMDLIRYRMGAFGTSCPLNVILFLYFFQYFLSNPV